jgi:hypothetical protein
VEAIADRYGFKTPIAARSFLDRESIRLQKPDSELLWGLRVTFGKKAGPGVEAVLKKVPEFRLPQVRELI